MGACWALDNVLSGIVAGIVAGVVAGITAPLILGWLQSSKWWRRREVSRIVDESGGRNWASERLSEMLDPSHSDYPIVCELLNENAAYIRAGKLRRCWIFVWGWIRGFR